MLVFKKIINMEVFMETIIKTCKLCKTFSNGGVQQHILKNLDVEIYKGDLTVIMGPSGSGKSTFLYALSGMDKPTLGDIFYAGKENITRYTENQLAEFRSKHCGFVFQQIYLVDSMSLLDNILLSGLLVNKKKSEVVAQAKKICQMVGIDESTYKKFPTQVSGGEAQRAGVARAVITNPNILFADEPTGALNSQNAKAVLDILSTLNRDGQSIVMVTHDINSALRADRIMYLKDGKIEGELRLEKYSSEDDDRKEKVRGFLTKLGW